MPDPRAHPGDAERERKQQRLRGVQHDVMSTPKSAAVTETDMRRYFRSFRATAGGKTEMREYIQNMQDAADGAGKT